MLSKPRNLILPRIYVDTNVLVAAILESELPLPQNEAKASFISNSCELLNKWEPTAVHTSNYAVGEFIARGRAEPFSKSYTEMLDIVKNKILSRYQIIDGRVEMERKVLGLSEWPKRWLLAEANFKGEAQSAKGDKIRHDYSRVLAIDGSIAQSRGGGVPHDYREQDYKLTRADSFSYIAPAFEILFFNKASELAIRYGIPFGDAIHLVYLTQERSITHLVTDDDDFHKKKNLLPVKIARPKDLLTRFRRYML